MGGLKTICFTSLLENQLLLKRHKWKKLTLINLIFN